MRQLEDRVELTVSAPANSSTRSVGRGGRRGLKSAAAVHAKPVSRDRALRIGELHGATADLLVQEILDRVFLMRISVTGPWFGPEVRHVGGCAAQLQANQVVELVIPEALAL